MLDLDMPYCCRICKYVTFTDHSSLIVKLKLSDQTAYFIVIFRDIIVIISLVLSYGSCYNTASNSDDVALKRTLIST